MLHIDHTGVNARGPGRFVNVLTYMPEPECEQSASHDHTRANWRCMHRHVRAQTDPGADSLCLECPLMSTFQQALIFPLQPALISPSSCFANIQEAKCEKHALLQTLI